MNIYKNLMFLHGHFVDPREADDETAAPAVARTPAQIPARVAAGAVSSRAQASRPRASGWRTWLQLWPRETAKVEVDCDARGCV
ncbi:MULTISPECIES: hypothetical protein [unclassified Lysobacter]|uniref:hypothetical protein n=1 Tax=unclassified Lysobacter TaxID=2635362 RepID=UPI001BED32A8|nr:MULTISPECIES: hypothetical protein [unclassified Lysobacter]MBT2750140.1 hypothetical protein [Lysobacter sp. ISL-50]MBT2775288.1 hypothetical protein [Lysobacter sp. ISL-54]MBT2782662.1 hypothetical protein [Lysobacter sp. ISL-52]